jgi:ATP-binding cassette subfamily B protein
MKAIADFIKPFDPAEGPPPQDILPFMRWALRGAERAILIAFAITFG